MPGISGASDTRLTVAALHCVASAPTLRERKWAEDVLSKLFQPARQTQP
jgi:hypothetical protein